VQQYQEEIQKDAEASCTLSPPLQQQQLEDSSPESTPR